MSAPVSPPPQRVPLWAPYYGASFGEAFVRFWRKYARFDGRASRSEYWWWALADALVLLVLWSMVLLGSAIGSTVDAEGSFTPGPGIAAGILLLIGWWLATVIPGLALAARRLHDVDLSALLLLLLFIPTLGGLAILVMTLLPPNPRGARFDRPDGEVPGYVPVVPGAMPAPQGYGWPAQMPLPYAGPAGGQPLYATPPPAPTAPPAPPAPAAPAPRDEPPQPPQPPQPQPPSRPAAG